MRKARKLLRISWAERWLLLEACVLVAAIRFALLAFPVYTVRRMLAALSAAPRRSRSGGSQVLDQVAWAVTVASELVPRAACLAQALAAQVLVERAGLPARLQIGVARGEGRPFEAHAWLVSAGRVVVGGAGVERYAPLLPPAGHDNSADPPAWSTASELETHTVAR